MEIVLSFAVAVLVTAVIQILQARTQIRLKRMELDSAETQAARDLSTGAYSRFFAWAQKTGAVPEGNHESLCMIGHLLEIEACSPVSEVRAAARTAREVMRSRGYTEQDFWTHVTALLTAIAADLSRSRSPARRTGRCRLRTQAGSATTGAERTSPTGPA